MESIIISVKHGTGHAIFQDLPVEPISMEFFNASRGSFIDVLECMLGLGFIDTPAIYYLHEMWNDFFTRSSSTAMSLQICHSQEAIHVRNGLLCYPEELRERILVVAIAPVAYIYNETCMKVSHYRAASARDFVPLFDLGGLFREHSTTEVLRSHPNASLHDHTFQSKTYERSLMKQINRVLLPSLRSMSSTAGITCKF